MKVTKLMIKQIEQRLSSPIPTKLRQSDIALGMGLSKPWVSGLMSGKIAELRESQVNQLESILGFRFQSADREGIKVSGVAARASVLAGESSEFASALIALVALAENPHVMCAPRFYATRDMNALGRTITAIVDENRDKKGKIARMVRELFLEDKQG
jgi:predicted XRE-type DNA-binding protein